MNATQKYVSTILIPDCNTAIENRWADIARIVDDYMQSDDVSADPFYGVEAKLQDIAFLRVQRQTYLTLLEETSKRSR